ncbi:hypothetical protein [Roseimicrobium sp. ORNL1]|uniref:hypothetical protein n=1 Tax=Roseimicrobium sp. ORNL1 TaxID=2711231 RepID=UPI0013E19B2D|nr:hypothetical protein [Roseimicrobium sp. ORNL1]QIF03838.1 hypothetical protein G5S37_20695 [Roseimicrobium sp. ORNL1]
MEFRWKVKERARTYISRMEDSVQGEGGSAAMFKVAVVLMRGFSLSEAEGMELLAEWNETHARPRWSPTEMRHKIADGAKADRPEGYLLRANSHEQAPSYKPKTPPRVEPRRSARERTPTWPAFSPLTDDDRDRIAILRKVPAAAVEVVRRAGLLGKAHYEGHDCFIMGEGKFAQARRFDGGLLPVQGGRQQSKAKNLPGSEGAFIGRKWAVGSKCPVLLVEGVIGLVEAIAALMMARDALDWTCLAAVSASSRFARDPYLLHALAGRRVHIVPDAGTTGWESAGAWLNELEKAGAHVQVEPVPLPVACKDLGDVVSRVYQNASPDDDIHFQGCVQRAPDDLREYLKDIFS